jgi:large subunit ribosomal protein L9
MLRIETMKIILKENIENLGKRGDIVDVAAGYARNYLVPRKLAIEVAPGNIKMVEMEQKALKKKLAQETISYQNVIDRIDQTSLSFERKAGEKDVIFGSVSVADIKEALDKLGFEIEKKKILLEEPIKRLGNYAIPIKIFHEKQAELRIEVKKEGEEESGKEGIEAEEKKEIEAAEREQKQEEKEGEAAPEKKESLREGQPERDEKEKKKGEGEKSNENSDAKEGKTETE